MSSTTSKRPFDFPPPPPPLPAAVNEARPAPARLFCWFTNMLSVSASPSLACINNTIREPNDRRQKQQRQQQRQRDRPHALLYRLFFALLSLPAWCVGCVMRGSGRVFLVGGLRRRVCVDQKLKFQTWAQRFARPMTRSWLQDSSARGGMVLLRMRMGRDARNQFQKAEIKKVRPLISHIAEAERRIPPRFLDFIFPARGTIG